MNNSKWMGGSFLNVFLLSIQLSIVSPLWCATIQQPVTLVNETVHSSLERIKSNIYKETFDNGLTLIFYKKEHTPEVMLKVVYDVGSKDEESSEYGFAHLVEHMIFKGTKKLSEQDIDEVVRKFGAMSNAHTHYDQTAYSFDTDNKNWRIFLAILADCMENVRIADEHLASELKTVFDEIKTRDDDCVGNVFTELLPSNHPYHHPVIGYKESLLVSKPEQVRAFYKKYYRPNCATVIVVGDLDKNEVVREVKALFGSIPCPQPMVGCKQEKSNFAYMHKDFFQKNLVVYKTIPDTVLNFVWVLPGWQDVKSSLCTLIVSKYLSDRLHKILHDEKQLVNFVGVHASNLRRAGVFYVSFQPVVQKHIFGKKGIKDVAEVCKNIITEELERIIVKGIPQDEFNYMRHMSKVALLRDFENCDSIAAMFECSYMMRKNEYEVFDRLQLLDSIVNADVIVFVQQYLRSLLMSSITYEPLKAAEKEMWVSRQSKVDEYDDLLLGLQTRNAVLEEPVAAYAFPNPMLLDVVFEKPDTEFDLKNGLHVMLKKRTDTPFVVATCRFKNLEKLQRYFAEHGKKSIPSFATTFVWEGSDDYSKEDNRKFFEGLGASCGVSGFTCMATDFDAVAQRFVHIYLKPAYPQKAFKKVIEESLEAIEKCPENEQFVAGDALAKHLEYNDFLVQRSLKELAEEVKKYKRSDLCEFHKKYMVPCNMVLAVVGDFNEMTIKQQLEDLFGQWKDTSQACDVRKMVVEFPELKNPEAKDQKIYLPRERVILVAGRITVKDNDDDYFRLVLLNQYCNKVLFQLREQQGLFYGCGIDLLGGATEQQKGQACISAELSLANVDEVIQLIKLTLSNFAAHGIPQEDFESARTSVVNNWAKLFTTNSAVAGYFVGVKANGYDWDYCEKRFEKIMHVTREEVNAAAKKYLNPDEWSFVTVGRVGEGVQKGAGA